MDKPKHRPGPWVARQEFANRWRIEVPKEGFIPVSVAIVTTTILETGASTDDIPANAFLMAAAPELLEACQFVSQYLDNLENGCDPDDPLTAIRRRFHAPLRAKLDPAIKKARGEA